MRNVGHAQIPLEQASPGGLANARFQLGVAHDRDGECRCDGGDRHVVVGRADAARGEDVVEGRGRRAHRSDDLGRHVGNHFDAPDANAQLAQLAHQEAGVLLFDFSGQNLVTDDDDGGSGSACVLARHGAQQ